MASEISATPSLDPSVPRIPSPLNRIPSTVPLPEKSENVIPSTQLVEKSPEATERTVAAPLASEQSSDFSDSTEFSPAADCVVLVPEPVLDVCTVDVSTVNGPAVDVSTVNGPAVDVSTVNGPAVDVSTVNGPAVDVSTVNGPAVDVSTVNGPAVDVSIVNGPAVDVPIADEPVADVIRVILEDEERSTPDTDIDDLRSNSRCCQECHGFARMYYTLAEFTNTEYAIPIWLLLMALPISAGFMGARYLNECKSSPSTPPLMFILGMSGVIMITAKILFILHKATWEQMVGRTCLYTTIALTYILTLLLLCTELMTFWRYTPSFEGTSLNYCNPTFYKYTFWINCITIAVFILMFIIRIPTSCAA